MTRIFPRRRNLPLPGTIGAHEVYRLFAGLIRRIDQESAIGAPAWVFLVSGAESQTPLICTIRANRENIESALALAAESDPIALRAPGRSDVVFPVESQAFDLAAAQLENKNIRVAAPVGDKGDPSAVRAPGWVDIDRPVPGEALPDFTVNPDQVEFRIAVLG